MTILLSESELAEVRRLAEKKGVSVAQVLRSGIARGEVAGSGGTGRDA